MVLNKFLTFLLLIQTLANSIVSLYQIFEVIIFELRFDCSHGIEVKALVTAQVLHECWHVEGVEHILLVNIEVLPCSAEVLIHIFIEGISIKLLMFLQNFFGSNLSPFLVHEEISSRRSRVILLFKGIFSKDMVDKLVR